MELFLILSIGLSIVALISVALHQEADQQTISHHNIETAFPLDSSIMNSEQTNILKLNDQVIPQDFNLEGSQRDQHAELFSIEELQAPLSAS